MQAKYSRTEKAFTISIQYYVKLFTIYRLFGIGSGYHKHLKDSVCCKIWYRKYWNHTDYIERIWPICIYIFYSTQYKIQEHSKIEPNKRHYHTFFPAGKAWYKSLYMVRVSQP